MRFITNYYEWKSTNRSNNMYVYVSDVGIFVHSIVQPNLLDLVNAGDTKHVLEG
jgi:hypothetical protein